jgi:hypothetical protein
MAFLVVVLCAQLGYSAINTGTAPTFVYQKDVSSNQDGASFINDIEFNDAMAVYNNVMDRGGNSWVSNANRNNQCALLLHFQAPAGCKIVSAQIVSRSYIRDDFWETVWVKGQWGTTLRQFIWNYTENDTQFYFRQQGSGAWYDTNTTNLTVGAPDLFLTFSTFQSGYQGPMEAQKGWFTSPDTEAYDPGLIVTLTIERKGDFTGDGVIDNADVDVLNAAISAGSTDLKYDLNNDGAVGEADVSYMLHVMMNTPGTGVINTGTAPTFVYQRDLSANHDGASIMGDVMINNAFNVYGNLWGTSSWMSNSDRAEQCGTVFHFQAPQGYKIISASVVSRSFVRDDFWETAWVKAQWGTTLRQFIWNYTENDTQFYYRQQGSTIWTDTNTTNLAVGAQDLFLTFSTFQSGYQGPMEAQKGWFTSPDTQAYDPGLIVTLTIAMKGDFTGDGIIDNADVNALSIAISAGSTDLKYDLNSDSMVGEADMSYLLHVMMNIPGTGVINVGTAPTFVYQRDLSANHDGASIMGDVMINDAFNVYGNLWETSSWMSNSGRTEQCGTVFHFQVPDGYKINTAKIVSRSFVRDDFWEPAWVKAQWGTTPRQFIWDYTINDEQFYYRQPGSSVWYDTNTTNLTVGAPDLFLTFSTFQGGYQGPMEAQKGWFTSPDTEAYDPGLIVTLGVSPILYVYRPLENFETTAINWTMPEANEQYTVNRQSAVKFEGNSALNFHFQHNANLGYWSRTKGIFPAGQDWTKFESITVKVKSSIAGATAFIGWDFLIDGTEDMYRVNGLGGCGSFTLPADTEWHTITLDLGAFTRSNVTALEFFINNDQSIQGTFDIYIDDIQLKAQGDAFDFNSDGMLNAKDIDVLNAAVNAGSTDTKFDLTGDGFVTKGDVDYLVHSVLGSVSGDANLDKMVDVGDLGILAANYGGSGKTWAQGDFNGDGLVDVGDLGILAANYGSGSNQSIDFSADYAKAFGTTVGTDTSADDTVNETGNAVCSGLGLPLVAGLLLAGMMLLGISKLEE